MSTYYQTLKDERKRLERLLEAPIQEGRCGIETLLEETTTAIAQLERGEHWTQQEDNFLCGVNYIADADWLDEQATKESNYQKPW